MNKNLRKNLKEPSQKDVVMKILEKDCSEILSVYEKTKRFLLRGSDKSFIFQRKTPRQDRKPRDSSKKLHDVLDELFFEKFGWRPRSEAVFTSPSYLYATDFGTNIYVIFPSNGFQCICEPENYGNIWTIRNEYLWGTNNFDVDNEMAVAYPKLKKSIAHYKEGNKALIYSLNHDEEGEIAIKCDYYYALNEKQLHLFDELTKNKTIEDEAIF